MATIEQLAAAQQRASYLEGMARVHRNAAETAEGRVKNRRPTVDDLVSQTLNQRYTEQNHSYIAHMLCTVIIEQLPMLYALTAAKLAMKSREEETQAKLLNTFLETYVGHIIVPMTEKEMDDFTPGNGHG